MYEKEQIEAIDNILGALAELDEALYSKEIAAIDRERADVFWNFYSAELSNCANEQERKACQDVLDACFRLKMEPCAKNARELDEKIETFDALRK